MRLVMHRRPEAVETRSTQDYDHKHEDEAELGLVDTVVTARKLDANIVVQGPGDNFAEDTEDKLEWKVRVSLDLVLRAWCWVYVLVRGKSNQLRQR